MATKATPGARSNYTQLNLQTRRAGCGLSLETIADSTKISIRFLRAIEDEEFEKLPGGIFSISYLKQYAGAIGFDEQKLLTFYSRKTEPERSEELVVRKPNRSLRRLFGFEEVVGR